MPRSLEFYVISLPVIIGQPMISISFIALVPHGFVFWLSLLEDSVLTKLVQVCDDNWDVRDAKVACR